MHISINTFYWTSLSNKHHQCNVWCIKHQFKPKTASAITIYCAKNVVIWHKSRYALSIHYYLKTITSFLTILIDATCVQKDESRIQQWLYRHASVTQTQQAPFYCVTELEPRVIGFGKNKRLHWIELKCMLFFINLKLYCY